MIDLKKISEQLSEELNNDEEYQKIVADVKDCLAEIYAPILAKAIYKAIQNKKK